VPAGPGGGIGSLRGLPPGLAPRGLLALAGYRRSSRALRERPRALRAATRFVAPCRARSRGDAGPATIAPLEKLRVTAEVSGRCRRRRHSPELRRRPGMRSMEGRSSTTSRGVERLPLPRGGRGRPQRGVPCGCARSRRSRGRPRHHPGVRRLGAETVPAAARSGDRGARSSSGCGRRSRSFGLAPHPRRRPAGPREAGSRALAATWTAERTSPTTSASRTRRGSSRRSPGSPDDRRRADAPRPPTRSGRAATGRCRRATSCPHPAPRGRRGLAEGPWSGPIRGRARGGEAGGEKGARRLAWKEAVS